MLNEFRSTSITWDKATRRIYSPITANESDSNGRKLNIQVVNSGQVENLTGATLHLYWETKDKAQHGLDAFTASNISKGEFEIYYTTGMLSNVGELNATLVLVDATGKVVSDWFKITVVRGIDDDAIQSENSFTALTQALIDISNLEQNYAPRLNDLTAQLQQKINKGNVLVTDINKNMGKFDGTYFSDEFLEDLNNGELNVTNLLDDSVTNKKLANNAVDYKKIDNAELINPHSLVNYDDAVFGHYYATNGQILPTANQKVYYIPKVEITGGQQYTFPAILGLPGVWLDKNETVISPLGGVSTKPVTLTAPINAKYFAWNGDEMVPRDKCIILDNRYGIKNLFLGDENIKSMSADKLTGNVDIELVANEVYNLVDYGDAVFGHYYATNGQILPTANQKVYYIPKVEIVGGYNYTFPAILGLPGVWLDKDDNVISPLGGVSTKPVTLTAPHNARYFAWNGDETVPRDKCMVVEGDIFPSQYVPHEEKVKLQRLLVTKSNLSGDILDDLTTPSEQKVSKLYGKTGDFIGDSITEHNVRTQKNYQDYIADRTGMTVINHGLSGSGFYNRYNVAATITAAPDYFTLFLGTNDFGNVHDHNLPLGKFGDTTNATVAGCIYLTLTGLMTKFPTVPIGIITPLPRLNNWGSAANANAQGYKLEELAELIIAYAKHFSLPYLDLYHESNLPVWIPAANQYYFTMPGSATPDGLHPNDNGHILLSFKIESWIESKLIRR